MTLVAFVGDCTTTTSLAVASQIPEDHGVAVVEADRTGGSIAAWLDVPATPSLSTLVARQRPERRGDAITIDEIESLIRWSPAGLRFVPAPARSVEAARAVSEAERGVFPVLARSSRTVLLDVGRRVAADGVPAALRNAETIVVVHRQETASTTAAGVRVERLTELIETLRDTNARLFVALIGDRPFDADDVRAHAAVAADPREITVVPLADDPLAAAVIAGRAGVSERRFARLPLVRSCRPLADELVDEPSVTPSGGIEAR